MNVDSWSVYRWTCIKVYKLYRDGYHHSSLPYTYTCDISWTLQSHQQQNNIVQTGTAQWWVLILLPRRSCHTVCSEYCCSPPRCWWRRGRVGEATKTQPPPPLPVRRRRRCRRRWPVRGSWCASPGRRCTSRERQCQLRSGPALTHGLSGRTGQPSSLSTETTQTLSQNVDKKKPCSKRINQS